VALHPGTNLAAVLGVCSVLVGDQPVGSRDPASVEVAPGGTVEFLPPFAGG
jgi:plastocyanin